MVLKASNIGANQCQIITEGKPDKRNYSLVKHTRQLNNKSVILTLKGKDISAVLAQYSSHTTFPTDWLSEELHPPVASSRSRLHVLALYESLGHERMEQWKQNA